MAGAGTFFVGSNDDDAQEDSNGTNFNVGASPLTLICNATATARRNVGLRFQGVTVPQAATITSATFSVYLDVSSKDDMRADLYADNADNGADFASNADVWTRVTTNPTTATVLWATDNLPLNQYSASPDISTIIQEIVNRSGWAPGNAIVLLMKSRADATKSAHFHAYETAGTNFAKLDLTWLSQAHERHVTARGVRRGIARGTG